jgi:hypothetical protein
MDQEMKKMFALLYEIKKRITVIEKAMDKCSKPRLPAKPVERSEEPLHGAVPLW